MSASILDFFTPTSSSSHKESSKEKTKDDKKREKDEEKKQQGKIDEKNNSKKEWCWMWAGGTNQWKVYDKKIQNMLEKAFKDHKATCDIGEGRYVDLKHMVQRRNDDPNKKRAVKRVYCTKKEVSENVSRGNSLDTVKLNTTWQWLDDDYKIWKSFNESDSKLSFDWKILKIQGVEIYLHIYTK